MIRFIFLVGLLDCELTTERAMAAEDVLLQLDARAPLGLKFTLIAEVGPRAYVRASL